MTQHEQDLAGEIRHALWGDVDHVARRIEAEGPDGPTARRVAAHRRLREVLGRVESTRTPDALRAWLAKEVERRKAPVEMDVSWLEASPMGAVGVRGDANALLACPIPDGEMRAQVHVEEDGAACAVTGRLIRPDLRPIVDRPVTLFVDRRERDATVSDRRGVFEFDEHRGSAFGVRVGDGAEAVHVSLVDRDKRKDDESAR